jgi:hypothetical protein
MQPNKHGVYPHDAAECIEIHIPKKASCVFYVLEIDGGEWIASVSCEFHFGDYSLASGPLSRGWTRHLTRAHALDENIGYALRHFHTRDRWGCATAEQVRVSIEMNNRINALAAVLWGTAEFAPSGTQLALF